MSAVDAQLLEIFRAEANDRLDRMVEVLVAIEDGSAAGDAVDALFREAHSVKGSAGMVGLDAPCAIAHELEEELNAARATGSLAADRVDELLRSVDVLRDSLGDAPAPPPPPPAAAEPAPRPPAARAPAPAPTPAVTTIRMPAEKVDRLLDAVSESALHLRRLETAIDSGDEDAEWELDRGKTLIAELQRAAIDMRTLPLASITGPYPRAIRDVAAAEGKEVTLTTSGTDTQLDRVILDGIGDALTHLLRNCVAHGIEPPTERERAGKPRRGRIELRAEQRGSLVAVEVSDDGRGVSRDVLARGQASGSLVDVLCAPGFSTAAQVSDVAGRGVGLDAVKGHVEGLGGSIEVDSTPGAGTTFRLLLPYSVALTAVLLIERAGHPFGVPLASIEEVVLADRPLSLVGHQALELRGRSVPLADLAALLGADFRPLGSRPRGVVVRSSNRRQTVACDRILGEQDVVVKSLGPLLAGVPGYLGAAILDTGTIAPILDPTFLSRRVDGSSVTSSAEAAPRPSKVLVVDDQFTVRELQRSILEAAGFAVRTAHDGRDACAQLAADGEIDLVVSDVNMPEMDGIELVETIRRDPKRTTLPVVLLTSLARDDDKRRGAEAGADAYIVKDEFDQRALLDTVERLLRR